ncbi:MAG: hypothetical protein PWQ59_2281 [Thermoanaerobacterium sp.]|nr:hypothetical protein [Thermoanaerobacterium sp.]
MADKRVSKKTDSNKQLENNEEKTIEVAALDLKSIYQNTIIPYETQFKPNGDLKGFNLQSILRDVQSNIYKIYELMAYYVESDYIFNSAVKNVLVPFSVTKYRLQGASEKSKRFFYDYFKTISLNDLLYGIYYDLYVFGNVFLYRHENGYIQILPPHRIEIQEVKIPNEPVLAYIVPEFQYRYSNISEKFIKTLEVKYEKGYPPEILEGIKRGERKIQLNPERCYTIQTAKSAWAKYAIPMGVSLLPLFSKKNLISESENSALNNAMKSLLHVRVGNKDTRQKPNENELKAVAKTFIDAVSGMGLAITAWDIEADWKKVDLKDINESIKAKYAEVNASILAGIGLASVIVTGDASGSSFAAAQVNASVASKRIMQNIKNVKECLEKIMVTVAREQRISENRIPEIIFEPVDLQTNQEAFDEILRLFSMGFIGYQTVFESLGYDYQQEKDRKEQEKKNNDAEVFIPPINPNTMSSNPIVDNEGGRPEIKNNQRTSDKNKSETGKQPKPSNS